MSSGAGASLPSRSYLHSVNHAMAGKYAQKCETRLHLNSGLMNGLADVHYSSPGVREQTAELSSSFLSSDSEMAQRFGRDQGECESGLAARNLPDPIMETSEPVTPVHESELSFSTPSTIKGPPEGLMISNNDNDSRSDRGFHSPRQSSDSAVPSVIISDASGDTMGERTPLLPRERLSSYRKQRYDAASDVEAQPVQRLGIWNRIGHHYPSFKGLRHAAHTISNPKSWDMRLVFREVVVRPVSILPSVFLGLLLNLLDALSYGIILFPLGEEVFSDMGADGVSMFYVSCIISQLVYSTGSIFRGGVGSEMVNPSLLKRGFDFD